MNKNFLCFISLASAISLASPALGMGRKSPVDRAQELKLIQDSQARIESLEKGLNLPVDAAPVINPNATDEDLERILNQQQARILDLESMRDENIKTQEDSSAKARQVLQRPDLQTTDWQESRCSALGDSLASDKNAIDGRKSWSAGCMAAYRDELFRLNDAHVKATGRLDRDLEDAAFTYDALVQIVNHQGGAVYSSGRWFYPSFGVVDKDGHPSNPEHLAAPVNAGEACNISYSVTGDGTGARTLVKKDLFHDVHYSVVAMCVSGCYTPDQKLAFKDGYEEIDGAFARHQMEILTLSSDSTLEKPKFQITPLTAYTTDLAPSAQEVLDFETLSGKKLTVTKNHPLLNSNGEMRSADTLKVGESLMLADGSPDPILAIQGRVYFGKVYNVRPKTGELLENIVAAQGVLSGSVYFQNEGTKDLNRALFRIHLPNNLVK